PRPRRRRHHRTSPPHRRRSLSRGRARRWPPSPSRSSRTAPVRGTIPRSACSSAWRSSAPSPPWSSAPAGGAEGEPMRRTLVRALAVVVAVAVLAAGGLFVYARFLAPEPAPALSLPEGRETGGTAVTHPSLSDGSPRSDLDGVWRVAPGSEAGYRV